MDYRFHNAEIGVMSEIMLPKKIQYQDFLFNSLVDGLLKFSYETHFNDNKVSAQKYLRYYTSLKNFEGIDFKLFDKEFRPIFQGYSMYEVDGVFRFEENSKVLFDEERTQIIKIFFLPDYKALKTKYSSISRNDLLNYADLFFSLSKITSYHAEDNIQQRMKSYLDSIPERKSIGKITAKQQGDLYNYFKNWVDAVALFVFGYIIHEICKNLKDYHKREKISSLEKEIWVSSQWGILINRTKLHENKKVKRN